MKHFVKIRGKEYTANIRHLSVGRKSYKRSGAVLVNPKAVLVNPEAVRNRFRRKTHYAQHCATKNETHYSVANEYTALG